jgi:hypothetical protein
MDDFKQVLDRKNKTVTTTDNGSTKTERYYTPQCLKDKYHIIHRAEMMWYDLETKNPSKEVIAFCGSEYFAVTFLDKGCRNVRVRFELFSVVPPYGYGQCWSNKENSKKVLSYLKDNGIDAWFTYTFHS